MTPKKNTSLEASEERYKMKRLIQWLMRTFGICRHQWEFNPYLTWNAPSWWKFRSVIKMPPIMDQFSYMGPIQQCKRCKKVK